VKRRAAKKQKVTKGMSSAVLLSILIHAGLFLLAGMLVGFTVVKKEEQKFEPPKAVERPKMKLKKPKVKVKVKKTSRPKQAKHILAKVNPAKMPEIQLPEMSGMGGEGFGGGVGDGFDMMPDLDKVTVFGGGQSIGNDFEGTFYDSKRDRAGRDLPVDYTGDQWRGVINKFLRSGWDTSVFSRYYRSSRKLYATSLLVPLMPSSAAPLAFGDKDAVGALWMVYYKGQLVHKDGITFRFWGGADEFLAVRVNGELVLALGWANWGQTTSAIEQRVIGSLWDSESADSRKYWIGNNRSVVGDWITLEPGVPLDMEILMGDNGSAAAFYLLVEEKGVEYEKGRQGNPILPAFKTAKISRDLMDSIYKESPEAEFCLTNGPVFNDYESVAGAASSDHSDSIETPEPVESKASTENGIRTWTFLDGRTVTAEFVTLIGGKVSLKNADGKIRKVSLEQFSDEDRTYIELARPPALDINFVKKFKRKTFHGGFYESFGRRPEDWGHYGVSFKQDSAGEYNHDLHVEMFVIGRQVSKRDAKYLLLDHQKTTFNPAQVEQRFYKFWSPRKMELLQWMGWWGAMRGEGYYGFLVTVTDERGEIIAVKSSNNWLYENLKNLKELSVGNFMDKKCIRTFPARLPVTVY